jgi:hypothetical protein
MKAAEIRNNLADAINRVPYAGENAEGGASPPYLRSSILNCSSASRTKRISRRPARR